MKKRCNERNTKCSMGEGSEHTNFYTQGGERMWINKEKEDIYRN